MAYTLADLDKALDEFFPQWRLAKAARPEAIRIAIVNIWIQRLPENTLTAVLREAWTDLSCRGSFKPADEESWPSQGAADKE